MPVRCSVCLIPEKPLSPEILKPKYIHGLFFSLVDRKLGEKMHGGYVKPFALRFQRLMKTEEGLNRFFLEVSFLQDELFPQFLSSLILGDRSAHIGELSIRYLKKPYIREENVKSYRAIYEEAEPRDTIVLDFLTPTTFKKGDYDHPLPEPRLIFKGLIRKWQRFSDLRIGVDLRETIERDIHLSGLWIKTRKVELSDRAKLTGFTGRVVLFVDSGKEEVLKWLNTLARFSEFAGVGRKTTMGFGAVRFCESEGESAFEGEGEKSPET